MESIKTKRCVRCGKELPIDMFNKSGKTADGHHSYCKPCLAEYTHIHQAEKEARKVAAQHAANLAGPGADTLVTAEGKTYKKVVAEPVCKQLKDYTGAEIFAELKRRGYKWPDNTIYMKMYVNYDKI